MKFAVALEPESALAIAKARASGNEVETVQHIPGSSWRGAAAAELMRELGLKRENAHRNAEFRALFLEGKARFGDLRSARAVPWPLSARVCGLRKDEHPVQDLLLAEAAGRPIPEECGVTVEGTACGGKLETGKGYYERDGSEIASKKIPTRIQAHTAISNCSLRIRAEQFFSAELLDGAETFRGDLIVRDEAEAVVRKHFPEAGMLLAVGRGATRGQGFANLKTFEADDLEDDLRGRLRSLNRWIDGRNRIAFTCTLRSPCIVYDEWLMSRPKLAASDIVQAAGVAPRDLDGYEVQTWFSRLTSISGWNAQARLPKPDVLAMQAGSAFLFAREFDDAAKEQEIERLAGILAKASEGIGERWEEGFGEAVFCDPIHYEQAVGR